MLSRNLAFTIFLTVLVARSSSGGWLAEGLAAAVLAALWVSRFVSRPLDEMSRMAARLANGDYEARARGLPQGELGRLGAALNGLAESIQSAISGLSQEKTQLSAVLDTMVEGVIAVDNQGRVLLINPALAQLLKLDPEGSRGKPFLELLRHSQLSQLLEEVLKGGQTRVGEVRMFIPEERVFEVQALPIYKESARMGALAVLHDISNLRRLEQVRKDFVANVSHELRTPLASIRGFTETLKSGGLDDRKNRLEFLETIETEADRMNRLVDDLLELSAIESGQRQPKLEPVDPLDVAREIAEHLKPLAERRRVTIRVRVQEGLPKARADKGQLRQVFTNLLDNAIKFNKEGGAVEVFAQADRDRLVVSVKDTGVGIPQHEISRVFERFYRVDKARSRELGGTGLGLAIVKHIVEAHGGSVSVESVEDEGSTFRFTLPARP